MNALISTTDLDDGSLVKKAKEFPSMSGLDLAKVVTTKTQYNFSMDDKSPRSPISERKDQRGI